MRLLRFLLVFLGVAILVVGSIFWINRDSFITVFQNRAAILEGSEWVEKTYSLAGLIEFMAEQPRHAALVSIADPSGNGPIRYRSDHMYPAGTLAGLFIIITYAEQVTSGTIHPDDPVDPGHISSFYIPDMDRHYRQQLERWILDQEENPRAGALVRYLSRHNDPAVADYLYFYLGAEQVRAMTLQLGNGMIEPPFPQYGLRMMALKDVSGSRELSDRINELSRKERDVLIDEAETLARVQWENPKEAENASISSFQDQRALHGLYPRIQPDRFAELLRDIRNNRLINPETSMKIREIIQKPVEDRLLEPHVNEYASRFDERMGYLAGWTLAGPAGNKSDRSIDNKSDRIQVIIIQDIPAGLWFHMNSNFMIRDYHHRLIYDPSVRERTRELLMPAGRASQSTVP